jgi:acyl-CoA thioester hydrolase
VQEAVVDYWSSVAPPSAVAEHLWVALKHEITYLRPTFLQDNVVAEVIAEKVEGARAFFRTVLRRGDEVLSEVRSCWCCLDAVTQRPARLARDVVWRFFPPTL